MLKVYKYPLSLGRTSLQTHKGAELLSVKEQHGVICLWALVETDSQSETREIEVVGTGHPIEVPADHLHYIGHITQGPFEWHAFEVYKGAP